MNLRWTYHQNSAPEPRPKCRFFLSWEDWVDPKGIIGCGYISSLPYPLPHWDEEKASQGLSALRTDLLFKVLSEKPIISTEQLKKRYPAYNWSPQASGLSVPEPIASELFSEIQKSPVFGFAIPLENEVQLFAEGKSRTITSRMLWPKPSSTPILHRTLRLYLLCMRFQFWESLRETWWELHRSSPLETDCRCRKWIFNWPYQGPKAGLCKLSPYAS